MKKYNQRVQGSWATLRLRATATVLLPLMTATLPFSVRGWAINDNTSNPNSVNASALKPGDVNVDDFCGKIVANEVDSEGKDWSKKADRDSFTVGVKGGTWGSSDEQWCANHGYGTDPTVQAEISTPSSEKCNVAMLTGDGTGRDACKQTSEGIFRCQMHNSQVIPQCLAYKSIGDAAAKQITVAAFDTAAAVACTAACFSGAVTFGATEMACQMAGTLATVSEIYAVLQMSSGTVSSIISGIAAAGGGAATALQFSKGGNGGGFGIGTDAASDQLAGGAGKAADGAKEAAEKSEKASDYLAEVGSDSSGTTYVDSSGQHSQAKELKNAQAKADKAKEAADDAQKNSDQAKAAKEKQDSQRDAACKAAVVFAAMTGLRAYSASQYKGHLQEEARSKIRQLASSVMTGNPGLGGNQGAGTNTGFAGITTAGGVVGGNGAGGSNGSSARVGGGTGTDPSGCTPQGCNLPEGLSSSATDGGILAQSGLDKLLAKPAADIASSLKNGASPGQAIQSALGATGSGIGGALATLASEAQSNPSAYSNGVSLGSAPAGGMYAGGGGSSARSGSDSNPFGNLFGGAGAGAGGARATASEEFGKGRVMDIYHTGTSQNLFEIISSKVSSVAGRVGAR